MKKILFMIGLIFFNYSVNIFAKEDLNKLLFDTIKSSDVAKTKEVLKKGADVNAKDDRGYTPLRCATRQRYKEIAELLKKAGAKE